MSEDEKRQIELVQRATAQLMEHFDSVQIFVTKNCGKGSTLSMKYGDGNWFSRYGQVRLWLMSEEEGHVLEATGDTTE